MVIKQSFFLLILAAIIGFGYNVVSHDRLDFIGKYRDLNDGDGPIIPPASQKGDPPFIDVNVAQMEHSTDNTLFVDARDPYEFECGTIPGSINVPFDYLPAGDLAPYIDSALGGVSKNHSIIVFCSGEECDLSLHLARNLQALGYSRVSIFFGGSREWEKFGFPVERRQQCEG